MSNVIKYNYVRLAGNESINVTSNYDGFFKTVGQVIPKENIISNDMLPEEKPTDIGEILTAPRNDMQSEMIEQNLREQEEILNRKAEAIIADANIRADKIIEEANDNSRFIYEDSKKKGYDAGYTEGLNKAKAEAMEMKQRYENLILENEEVLKKESQMLESKIVETVCHVLDDITGICVSEYSTAIVNVITRALQKGENSNNYYIRVSSKDYPIVSQNKGKLMECVREDAFVDIMPDADMNPGQCWIETDGNVIDASIDEQLKNLKTNLRLIAGIQNI